jgi:putative spermidine/putrescine transport system substrate-binding protein
VKKQRSFKAFIPFSLVIASMAAACAAPPSAQQVQSAVQTAAPTLEAAATTVSAAAATAAPASGAMSMDELVKAAQAEGTLNVIALPHDWANYGEMIETFKKKYGLQVNEINPDAGSADEIEAIRANKENKGPQAPDVIDVGFAFGDAAKKEGLIQPYKVATWDTIPANLKDAEGYWFGGYYGVLTFEVNKDVVTNVPQDWADLLKPEYKGQVALAGDPRKSAQAINAVYAAGLANGGSLDDAEPGLKFFNDLNKAGNFVPVIAKPATIAKGETPVTIRWDYNALANRDASAGNPTIEVIVPKSGVLAGTYVQAISAYAPHPNAAKLWMEFLFSDEGQLIWLKGYAHPIRFADLVKRNVIPEDLMKKLPDPAAYDRAAFPTNAQLEASKKVITEGWDKMVGADVK